MKIAEVRHFLQENFNYHKHINFEDYMYEKAVEEDEMTSAILSTAPQGGALECGDNYAPGDMRVPKVLGKIQRRKKKA